MFDGRITILCPTSVSKCLVDVVFGFVQQFLVNIFCVSEILQSFILNQNVLVIIRAKMAAAEL